MKHRYWARILCMLLVALLPVSALAAVPGVEMLEQARADGKEIVTTLSFVPGTALSADQAVADLSATTSLRIQTLPNGCSGLTLVMDNTDIATIQTRTDNDGLYVASTLLGEENLYLSWSDLLDLIGNALKESGAVGEDQLSMMKTNFDKLLAGGSAIPAATETEAVLTEEDIYAQITKAMGGDEGYVNWIKEIRSHAVVTKGEYTGENRDTADTKTEMTITQDDYASLLDVPYFRNQAKQQLINSYTDLSSEEAEAKAEEEIVKMQAEIRAMTITVPVTIYTKGNNELVAVEVHALIVEETTVETTTPTDTDAVTSTDTEPLDEIEAALAASSDAEQSVSETTVKSESQTVTFDFAIEKRTLENGKTYHATMAAAEDDEPVFSGEATLKHEDANWTLVADLYDEDAADILSLIVVYQPTETSVLAEAGLTLDLNQDSQQAYVLSYKHDVSDSAIDGRLALAAGKSVGEIAESPDAILGTIVFNTVVQDDSGAFESIAKATPENSLQPANMTGKELSAFAQTVQSSSLKALYALLAKLPESAMSLISPLMMGE